MSDVSRRVVIGLAVLVGATCGTQGTQDPQGTQDASQPDGARVDCDQLSTEYFALAFSVDRSCVTVDDCTLAGASAGSAAATCDCQRFPLGGCAGHPVNRDALLLVDQELSSLRQQHFMACDADESCDCIVYPVVCRDGQCGIEYTTSCFPQPDAAIDGAPPDAPPF